MVDHKENEMNKTVDTKTLRPLVERLIQNMKELNQKHMELLKVCLIELKSPYPTRNRKDLIAALEQYLTKEA